MASPILEGNNVSSLLPQKPPFEMVDKLWYNDPLKTISGFKILPSNIFCKNGLFMEPGLIENIAQTASLHVGYSALIANESTEKKEPPIGYIGSIKKLVIHQLPKVESELKTEVTIQHIVFNVTMIAGRSMVGEELIAECEMKIFLIKD